MLHRLLCALAVLALLYPPPASADGRTASMNPEVQVLPVPGEVTIDGDTDDWDLSAGVWSYNDPTVVDRFSVWTHLMWDERGIYFLARYHDESPMENAAAGRDFANSWRADCYQARIVFDDGADGEHQMHVNMYYSSPDERPIMIVRHGGMKTEPPYDDTGPRRDDQMQRWGPTMESAGGSLAAAPWPDGKGYDLEAFWPWEYCRTGGEPLWPGDRFTFGLEAIWGNAAADNVLHRLADGVKDDEVNRIFMFRSRHGWGDAVIRDTGNLDITQQQAALQRVRLKAFRDYDTYGSIPVAYGLPGPRDVTIAIDNAQGVRVRNLIGQYPREPGDDGSAVDRWDGLDDAGNPVEPGAYTARVLHHEPITMRFFNSVYSSATPPWITEEGSKLWGANHGHPTSVATRGDVTILFFTGTEGGSGIQRVDDRGIIQWADGQEFVDGTLDDTYVYGLCKSLWQNQTLLFRYRVSDGRLVPFDDENRTPSPTLLPDKDISVESSLALAHDALWAVFPGRTFLKIDPRTGAVTDTLALDGLAAVADHDGQLYGLYTDGRVATLDADGRPTPLFTLDGLGHPARLSIDQAGRRFAISDVGTHQVHVVGRDGETIHSIGEARDGTDRPAGRFVETDLIHPLGMGFDNDGRLWVAEGRKSCKRVTLWGPDYALLDQFWGQADYGATNGFALTHDATRFIAHGIEFQLDPDPDPTVRKTNERPLMYHPALEGDQRGFVYESDGREYAVSAPGFHKAPDMSIFRRDEAGVFRPVVRVYPDKVGDRKSPMNAWVDRNDNFAEDPDEVTDDADVAFLYWSNGWVRPDFVYVTTNGNRFEPRGFTGGGTPLYDFDRPQKVENWIKVDNNQGSTGTPIMDLAGNVSNGIAFHTADGRRGEYPNPYGRHNAPAAQRGLLIAPFRTNGVVENVPGVGSLTALAGDRGEWFLMSMDGLYVAAISQDAKGGVTMDDTFIGQESFGGFIWRDTASGKVLVQLGGPSYRLMEVLGLETGVAETVSLDVSAEQVAEGQRIAAGRGDGEADEPDELAIARTDRLPDAAPAATLTGEPSLIDGVSSVRVTEAGNPSRWFEAAMAHDGDALALAFRVADDSPWQNGAGRYTHAFIGGDAVDLQLDVPGRGPIRLLVAPVGGDDTAVYWQSEATQKDNATTYVVANNPGNAATFDIVKRLDAAKIDVQRGDGVYAVLLRVPLAELGLDKAAGRGVKGVVGVIHSDPSGTNRAARLYWHHKNTGMVSDVPTEARLVPDAWGDIRVAE